MAIVITGSPGPADNLAGKLYMHICCLHIVFVSYTHDIGLNRQKFLEQIVNIFLLLISLTYVLGAQ